MHLATYTTASAGRMLAHYERSIGERDHIDRDGEVYNLAPTYEGGCHKRFADLCDGLEVGAKTRPLADMVVTMPEGFEGDREGFFEAAYGELAARVGEERIVCAYVHLDEPGAQPHMHFAFVPVVEQPVMTNDKAHPLTWTRKDEEKNPAHKAGDLKRDSKGTVRYKRVPLLGEDGKPVMRRTATASKMFTKEEMRELHPRMERALCEKLGVGRVGITLDPKDAAKKKLSALKHDEYVRVTAEIERAEGELRDLGEQVRRETDRLERLRLEPTPPTLAESARTLWTARTDGKREGELAGDIERLRSRIRVLEGGNSRSRNRMGELERGRAEAARRVERLRGGLDRAARDFEALAGRVRGYVCNVGERVAALLNSLGVEAYAGNAPMSSMTGELRAATRAAELSDSARGWEPRQNRGWSR